MAEENNSSEQLKETERICGNCDSFCECGLIGKKQNDPACEMFYDGYYQFKKRKEKAK